MAEHRQILLWFYAGTIALFSVLGERFASQDWQPDKRHLLNVYFVKVGWAWTSLPLVFFIPLSTDLLGQRLGWQSSRTRALMRIREGTRYCAGISVLVLVASLNLAATSLLIDSTFRIVVSPSSISTMDETSSAIKTETPDSKEVVAPVAPSVESNLKQSKNNLSSSKRSLSKVADKKTQSSSNAAPRTESKDNLKEKSQEDPVDSVSPKSETSPLIKSEVKATGASDSQLADLSQKLAEPFDDTATAGNDVNEKGKGKSGTLRSKKFAAPAEVLDNPAQSKGSTDRLAIAMAPPGESSPPAIDKKISSSKQNLAEATKQATETGPSPSSSIPKFTVATRDAHANELKEILKMDYKKLSQVDSEASRQYLTEFATHYTPLNNHKNNEALVYNSELIELVFQAISDEKHPHLDKLFNVLMILSRNAKSKGPNQGVEPRIGKILEQLKKPTMATDAGREALRALINYAEANTKVMADAGAVDIVATQMSTHMSNPSFQTAAIWVVRNMTVSDVCRKAALDRVGFLIVNTMNAHINDRGLIEIACWALGNLALAEDSGSFFGTVSIFAPLKGIMMNQMDNERFVEAICWFLYNVTFDANVLKTVMRSMYEEPLLIALRKYIGNNNIQEWADVVVRRIRAAFQAGSPAAVAERNANKALYEGYLSYRTGLKKRWIKKYFVLQQSRLACADNEKDTEIEAEFTLRDVVDIVADKENKCKFIIMNRSRIQVFEAENEKITEIWITQLRSVWKSAVANVVENLPSPDAQKNPSQPFFFSVSETVLAKDVEKFCLGHILHEVYTTPNYIMYEFQSQKRFPNAALWDYFAASYTRKTAMEFIEKKLKATKVPDKEVYDAEKMKKDMTLMVEESLMKEVIEFDKSPKMTDCPEVVTRYEYSAKQGIRPTMEDRHAHLPYLDVLIGRKNKEEPVSYYAVYDGHGGTHVAQYVETHLHCNVLKHEDFEKDVPKALKESFMRTQDDLKDASERLYLPTNTGSTGAVICFKGKKMHVAWAGDSMASIYTKKKDFELIHPHKATQETEKARIEKLGGFISEEGGVMRVNGVVAVTRSFGNIRHRVIIPEADISTFDLTGDEEYIVLACDGLWDVMDTVSVRRFVNNYMSRSGKRTKGISEALVDEALRLGSTDNVSVIFIEFFWWKTPKRQ